MTSAIVNRSVVRQLLLKDCEINQHMILLALEMGAVTLLPLMLKRQTPVVLGIVCFFIVLIVFGCMISATNILNERKKQTLPFIMSLPLSATQYATGKLLSTLAMFVAPWVLLTGVAMWLILGTSILPHGAIPMACILLLLPLVGSSFILGMTLAGETEGWNMMANLIGNSSYGIVWYLITQSPALMQHPGWKSGGMDPGEADVHRN